MILSSENKYEDKNSLVLDEDHPWPALDAFPEEAERFFNGRDCESKELLERVSQAPLTVLFGRSGLGKTSLLKAGIFPLLRTQNTLPVYIKLDVTAKVVPLIDQVIQRFKEELERHQIDAPEFLPGESLWSFLHRRNLELWSSDNWRVTPLFVFDQFEQIFTLGSSNIPGITKFRSDLADLVENRIPADVHRTLESGEMLDEVDLECQRARFLFSFREDFLAEFELWRGEIPSIMYNRFRLIPMNEKQAFDAVYETGKKVVDKEVAREIVHFVARKKLTTPAECFAGSEFDRWSGPAIVTKDHVPESDVQTGEPAICIEPALLSVLCTGLNSRRETEKKIALDLLETSADEIINEFYDKAISGLDKKLLDYLETELITEGGYRKPCALEDAQNKGGLDGKSLKQLEDGRILRQETRGKVKWLELTHDLLTSVVRAHRDQRREEEEKEKLFKQREEEKEKLFKQREEERKKLLKRQILAAIFVVLVIGVWVLKDKLYEWENTEGMLGKLFQKTYRKEPPDSSTFYSIARQIDKSIKGFSGGQTVQEIPDAEMVFDNVARYLLWQEYGGGRLNKLKNLLTSSEKLLPKDYGVDRAGINYISLVEKDEKWPLTLRYSSDRTLDHYYFNYKWRDMAIFFAGQWGIPAPLRLKLEEEPVFGKQYLQIDGEGFENLVLDDVPQYEDTVIISSKGLPSQARDFFNNFTAYWYKAKAPGKAEERAGPWWIVPRWSLPVWKVSGVNATEWSGFYALLIALEMQKRPEVLLTPQSVSFLLDRINKTYPYGVSEARAARGERLPQDLIEIVKSDRGITDLPVLLDELANYPKSSSSEIAEQILAFNPANGEVILPSTLHGPWATATSSDKSLKKEKETLSVKSDIVYDEVDPFLPAIEKYAIRVYLGEKLEELLAKDNQLSPELMARIEQERDIFFKRFGIELPPVLFKSGSVESNLGDLAFRVELFNETSSNPIEVEADQAMNKLFNELRYRSEWARGQFLTADKVSWMKQFLSSELRLWLEKRYSLTDMKLLLRALVELTDKELKQRYASMPSKEIKVSAENNIRHLEWLLSSLTFWTQSDDGYDLTKMSENLRKTQKVWINRESSLYDSKLQSNNKIEEGIKALADGNMPEAESAFSDALKRDHDNAIQSFLSIYPAHLASTLQKTLSLKCGQSVDPYLTREERLYLEDYWYSSVSAIEIEERRKLGLCLFKSYSDTLAKKRDSIKEELLREFGTPEGWPEDDAAIMALELYQQYDWLTDPPEREKKAARFLESALARQSNKNRGNTYSSFLGICGKPGPRNWCWQRAYKLAKLRLDNGDDGAALALAFNLILREDRNDFDRALELVKAIKTLGENSSGLSEWTRSVLDYIEGVALVGLVSLGDEQHFIKAESLLKKSLSQPSWIPEYAYTSLADLYIDSERFREAGDLLDYAIKKWPKNVELYQYKYFQQLLTGDVDGALTTTMKLEENMAETPPVLFALTLGEFLTRQDFWDLTAREFLTKEHPYTNYIAMLLYSYMEGESKGEGKAMLLKYSRHIKPTTWEKRLKGGDQEVWREMLIAYYLGAGNINEDKIFGPLKDDESFKASNLANLSLPRRAMLCEAYFYDALLAKARGDKVRMKKSMEKVIETDHKTYIEYKIAKYMLSDESWFQ